MKYYYLELDSMDGCLILFHCDLYLLFVYQKDYFKKEGLYYV